MLILSLTPFILVYNSCRTGEFSSISSQVNRTQPPEGNQAPLSETCPYNVLDEVYEIQEDTTSPPPQTPTKKINFLFIVETSLATANTNYRDKINDFLAFITSNRLFTAQIAVARLGDLKSNQNTVPPSLYTQYLYPFEDQKYYIKSTEHSSRALLKHAFDVLSNPEVALDRAEIQASSFEATFTNNSNTISFEDDQVPLEIIVISAMDIVADTASVTETTISSHINRSLNTTDNITYMGAITTNTIPCNTSRIQSRPPELEDLLLSNVVTEVSGHSRLNYNRIMLNICTRRSEYNLYFADILIYRHGINIDTGRIPEYVGDQILPTEFNLTFEPADDVRDPVTIKKALGETWVNLSIPHSIEIDGSKVIVRTTPPAPLPPGEYQIKYCSY